MMSDKVWSVVEFGFDVGIEKDCDCGGRYGWADTEEMGDGTHIQVLWCEGCNRQQTALIDNETDGVIWVQFHP